MRRLRWTESMKMCEFGFKVVRTFYWSWTTMATSLIFRKIFRYNNRNCYALYRNRPYGSRYQYFLPSIFNNVNIDSVLEIQLFYEWDHSFLYSAYINGFQFKNGFKFKSCDMRKRFLTVTCCFPMLMHAFGYLDSEQVSTDTIYPIPVYITVFKQMAKNLCRIRLIWIQRWRNSLKDAWRILWSQ